MQKNTIMTQIDLYKLTSLFPLILAPLYLFTLSAGKLIIEALQVCLVSKFNKIDFLGGEGKLRGSQISRVLEN